MNKLFKEQEVTIYKVQKDLGLDKMRLYNYVTKKYKIESMPIDLLLKLAHYFKMEVNDIYNKMVDYQKRS